MSYDDSFKAVIKMLEPGSRAPRDIGKITLTDRPVKDAMERFFYDGQWRTGYIETVSPENWEQVGVVPTIRMIMTPTGR